MLITEELEGEMSLLRVYQNVIVHVHVNQWSLGCSSDCHLSDRW